jgi:hypothetical protein
MQQQLGRRMLLKPTRQLPPLQQQQQLLLPPGKVLWTWLSRLPLASSSSSRQCACATRPVQQKQLLLAL